MYANILKKGSPWDNQYKVLLKSPVDDKLYIISYVSTSGNSAGLNPAAINATNEVNIAIKFPSLMFISLVIIKEIREIK